MKLNPTFLEVVLLVLVSLSITIWLKYGKRIRRWWKDLRKRYRRPRQLKPREPADCPLCAAGFHQLPKQPRQDVVPWSQIRSPRGRKKTIDTTGYACLNPFCGYFGNADPAIHALVSNGSRGINKDIPYFKCQACGSCKSSRLNTPMYYLKTPIHHVAMVMHALTEGLDISAASRIFGHHHSTISRWLERGGQHSVKLHERLFFQAVEVGHLQLDELVTRVKKNAERVWVWTAVTAKSKLILAVHLGGRTIGDACSLLHQVSLSLAPGCLPAFSSDGLNQYFYAITAHFGFWDKPKRARKYHWAPDERLQYAQLRKLRQGRKVTFLYSIIRLGTRAVLRKILLRLELTGLVQTSYVERANLTLRELIAALSRRTWSMAYDIYHLRLHIMWGLAYYHLARSHQSLLVRVRGPSRHRYRTPAMAAGLTTRRWTVADILLLPLPEKVWLSPFPAG